MMIQVNPVEPKRLIYEWRYIFNRIKPYEPPIVPDPYTQPYYNCRMNRLKRIAAYQIRLIVIPPFLIGFLLGGFWAGWGLGEKVGRREGREDGLKKDVALIREGYLIICDDNGKPIVDYRERKVWEDNY
jgi:hypothetical protein